MRGTMASNESYSSITGSVFLFNLIVGTGSLTLPAAFKRAGWALGSVLLSLLCLVSFVTAAFVVEAMASANAIVHWRRCQRQKQSSSSVDDERQPLLQEESNVEAVHGVQVDVEQPTTSTTPATTTAATSRSPTNGYYEITEVMEMGKMAAMFFSPLGRTLFYISLTVYLYGDLAIYGTAVAQSLRDVACTFRPNSSVSDVDIDEQEPCWHDNHLTRFQAYRLAVCVFALVVGPFAFANLQKTKWLQLLTTLMRWAAFIVMIALATSRILSKKGNSGVPVVNVNGLPSMFGSAVYSFMCHHSLPSLITPIEDKRHVYKIVILVYGLILAFYFLLSFTGIFGFEELFDLYTLNFQPSPDDSLLLSWVHIFISLFPVFTLSTSFPIIAITLRNNLKALFLAEGRRYSWCTRGFLFPLLAVAPPLLVSFLTSNLQFLVSLTGSYAGAAVQYLVPAFLAFCGRRVTKKILGPGVINHHASVFSSDWAFYAVNIWAVVALIIVTYNNIVGS